MGITPPMCFTYFGRQFWASGSHLGVYGVIYLDGFYLNTKCVNDGIFVNTLLRGFLKNVVLGERIAFYLKASR